jgi:hypothetical protein
MRTSIFAIVSAATLVISTAAGADPWKDESGKGRWRSDYGAPYARDRGEYKEEFYAQGCKVKREWKRRRRVQRRGQMQWSLTCAGPWQSRQVRPIRLTSCPFTQSAVESPPDGGLTRPASRQPIPGDWRASTRQQIGELFDLETSDRNNLPASHAQAHAGSPVLAGARCLMRIRPAGYPGSDPRLLLPRTRGLAWQP